MDDEARQEQIRDTSDRLVDLLDEIRGLEEEKRTERMSTRRFHELADRVEDVPQEVWQVADERESA